VIGEVEREAIEIYSTMGGLDWAAIPLLFSLYNVQEPERMVQRLVLIRDLLNGK